MLSSTYTFPAKQLLERCDGKTAGRCEKLINFCLRDFLPCQEVRTQALQFAKSSVK